jgi:hypothetical protein
MSKEILNVKYYDVREISEIMKLSERTVRQLYKDKFLNYSIIGRNIFFTEKNIKDYLETCKRESN